MEEAYPELLEPAANRVPEDCASGRKALCAHAGPLALRESLSDDLQSLTAFIRHGMPTKHATGSYPGRQRHFNLYDTYGLPLDFIEDCRAGPGHCRSIEAGFDNAMQEQRTRARASWKGGSKEAANPALCEVCGNVSRRSRIFISRRRTKDCRIEAIITKNGSRAAN